MEGKYIKGKTEKWGKAKTYKREKKDTKRQGKTGPVAKIKHRIFNGKTERQSTEIFYLISSS